MSQEDLLISEHMYLGVPQVFLVSVILINVFKVLFLESTEVLYLKSEGLILADVLLNSQIPEHDI